MIGVRFVTVTLVITLIACCLAAPAPNEDGKYHPETNSGRYIPSDEGKYVHRDVPYVHVHDARELGQYHHIHIPYDGGYGPYSGSNIPYRHDESGSYSDKYQVSTLDINPDSFDIPRPDILLEYGFPDHKPISTPAPALEPFALGSEPEPVFEAAPEPVVAESAPEPAIEVAPVEPAVESAPVTVVEAAAPEPVVESTPEPATTASEPTPETKRRKRSIATNAQQQTVLAILPIRYISAAINEDDEFLVDSQPKTTTTERPRVRYLDEGKWKIIRQEEEKKSHKYDYLYLTENGIYAEEQAKLRDESNRAHGTNSKGYYEYPGDDGKIYMVHYTVGEQGFVPMADHIPTTPPVPHAIQRALDYVAAKKGGVVQRRF